MRTVKDILGPDDLAESVLIWEPDIDPITGYNPKKEDDFPAFEVMVTKKLAELIPWLGRPLPEGNPHEERAIAKELIQTSWWVMGMLSSAEHYMIVAKRRASHIKIDPHEHPKPNADQIKYRMAEVYVREQRLVNYLTRILDAIKNEVIFVEANLKSITEEFRMTGADSRL